MPSRARQIHKISTEALDRVHMHGHTGPMTTQTIAAPADLRLGFCYQCGQHPDDMGSGFRESIHGSGHHRSPQPLDLRDTLLSEHRAELDAIAESLGIKSEYASLGAGFAMLQALSRADFKAGLRAARA